MALKVHWLILHKLALKRKKGVLCLVISYRLADPSSVSVFEYFGIPVSFILGWLFFTEAPFSTLFPGVLLIIGAGLLIIFRERRVHQDNI